jgi:hypothetical protein
MYVKELADNMLVIPAPGSTWQFGPDDSEEKVLEANGVSGHIILHLDQFPIPGYKCLSPTPAMYLYKRHDEWMYGGVYTHHYLLVNGMVCIIDGYQFKDIEQAK